MSRSILLIIAITISTCSTAQSPDKHLNTDKGLALEGYDAVAYFSEKKAVEGEAEISSKYQGASYYFKSVANKKAFDNNPAAYLPQYGGWCAYAMGASGEKVEVDPATFKIRDGKLYLFYNRFFNNTLTKWNENEAALQQKANKNWSKIVGGRTTVN